ncbi:hypothetical protein [Paenibacillus amylolyticus]|uniref:hypothetical protein n=1 Tax=Paenibacillus amylolyticus TaxID=1451 RepID=UPI00201E07CB|nr:hypothetical protein [Paenibacillus amylolyticus]MCL6663454.1 hypothetical protein [Paenibacillus amylolyticus]
MSDNQGKTQTDITEGNITGTKLNQNKRVVKETKSERHSMRLLKDDKAFVVYWAEMFDMDVTELMITSVRHYVSWKNKDFDLPTAEMQRLNQLIDAMESMASSNEKLSNTVINGFDAMMGMMRGDNYLIEPENGDLINERR